MSGPRRLWVSELPADGGALVLPRESVEHVQVLRLRPGAEVKLFDARGGEASAQLTQVARGVVECHAGPRRAHPPRRAGLQLVLAVPKAAKLELVVRMLTELGVAGVQLVTSERSVPKLSADSLKLERLARVAREACAQSGQAFAPELRGPSTLAACLQSAPAAAAKLAFWEEADASLSSSAQLAPDRDVWIVIGPEGGLSHAEAELLQAHGFALVRLGRSILRVETACVVASALVLDRMAALGA